MNAFFQQLSLLLDLPHSKSFPQDTRNNLTEMPVSPTHKPPFILRLSQPNQPLKIRTLHIQGQTIEYILKRRPRRSIGFLINQKGLCVSAPGWITIRELEQSIHEKQNWIFKKLNEQKERALRHVPTQILKQGTQISYMGTHITLHLQAEIIPSIQFNFNERTLTISTSSEYILKEMIYEWYRTEALRIFSERLSFYAKKLDVTYHSFSLSSATTQWGSCTSNKKIRLNWKLIFLPLTLIDYVVAHELSHLKEMNHSAQFWATVYSAFPNFKAAKKTLKQYTPNNLPNF